MKNEYKEQLKRVGCIILNSSYAQVPAGSYDAAETDKITAKMLRKHIDVTYAPRKLDLNDIHDSDNLNPADVISISTGDGIIETRVSEFFGVAEVLQELNGISTEERLRWDVKPAGRSIATIPIDFPPKRDMGIHSNLMYREKSKPILIFDAPAGVFRIESTGAIAYPLESRVGEENEKFTEVVRFATKLKKGDFKKLNGKCICTIYQHINNNQTITIMNITNERREQVTIADSETYPTMCISEDAENIHVSPSETTESTVCNEGLTSNEEEKVAVSAVRTDEAPKNSQINEPTAMRDSMEDERESIMPPEATYFIESHVIDTSVTSYSVCDNGKKVHVVLHEPEDLGPVKKLRKQRNNAKDANADSLF